MIFNDQLDSNTSHTVLNVLAPVRLVCLGHAGLAPGVYKVEGDLRCKFISIADQRLLGAGLLTVTYHEAGAPTTPYVGKEEPIPKMTYMEPVLEKPGMEVVPQEKCELVEDTKSEGEAVVEGTIDTDSEPLVILEDKPKRRGRPSKVREMQPVNEDATV